MFALPTCRRETVGTRIVHKVTAAVVAFGLGGVMMLSAGAARAEVFALAIGIDQYDEQRDLEGATADSEDIARAVRTVGGTVIQLQNEDASRDRILAAWQWLIENSSADDTLILSYAGHGVQHPERLAGNEVDGKDEVLVLSQFANAGPRSRERIIDDEIDIMIRAAAPRRVIFVADGCYSGTMLRSLNDDRQMNARYLSYQPIRDDALRPPGGSSGKSAREPDNVIFVSAGHEAFETFEVLIDGRPRGAMSWAFARALEGAADQNSDNRLSVREMYTYVYETTKSLTLGRQVPQFLSAFPVQAQLLQSGGRARVVDPVVVFEDVTRSGRAIDGLKDLDFDPSRVMDGAAPGRQRQGLLGNQQPQTGDEARRASRALHPGGVATFNPLIRPVALHVQGRTDTGLLERLAAHDGVDVVTSARPGGLTWDVSRGQVRSTDGRVVAVVAAEQGQRVPQVVNAWQTISALLQAPSARLQSIRSQRGAEVFGLGEEVRLAYKVEHGQALRLFYLSSDARLYDVPASEIHVAAEAGNGRTAVHSVTFEIAPPYGLDHVIAVIGEPRRLASLNVLAPILGQPIHWDAIRLLVDAFEQSSEAIVVAPIYSDRLG